MSKETDTRIWQIPTRALLICSVLILAGLAAAGSVAGFGSDRLIVGATDYTLNGTGDVGVAYVFCTNGIN